MSMPLHRSQSSSGSGGETTWVRRCRWYRTSQTPSRWAAGLDLLRLYNRRRRSRYPKALLDTHCFVTLEYFGEQDWIERVAHEPVDGRPGHPDVCVIELGGTVGDIESMPFIEASP